MRRSVACASVLYLTFLGAVRQEMIVVPNGFLSAFLADAVIYFFTWDLIHCSFVSFLFVSFVFF